MRRRAENNKINDDWKLPKLLENINLNIQKAQWTTNRKKMWRDPQIVIVKISKNSDKENILKTEKEKGYLLYKGRVKADFSSETMEARR